MLIVFYTNGDSVFCIKIYLEIDSYLINQMSYLTLNLAILAMTILYKQ